MSKPTSTLYDAVFYPSALYPHTHPDRLATMATLFGLKTAPVEGCRVLELGCGDGANLIAMAYALPRSQFVGIDLAALPIATGLQTIEELGLKNIRLRQLDLMQLPSDLGPFDYIIAHGLYSWVPENVRDRLLAICGSLLTDNGVAYVSYNAYPGCHFRDFTRGMMRYHVAKFADPDQQIQQARALLKFLADSKAEPEAYHYILKSELHQALTRPDNAFFHDTLSDINQPVYFHQFVEHAARHGLQYLSEANLWAMHLDSYPAAMRELLNDLDPADVIAREQYNDFVECRPFRRTLLCRAGIELNRSLQAERLFNLRFAANLHPTITNRDPPSESQEIFKGPAGVELETSHPLVKAALTHLGAVWPQSIAFKDLLGAAQTHLSADQGLTPATPDDKQRMATALLQAHISGCLEFHAYRAPFVTTLSERPVASALARLQLSRTNLAPTLRHELVRVDDSLSRHLLLALDGTRDRADLLKHLGELIKSGAIPVSPNSKSGANFDAAIGQLTDGIDDSLIKLAQLPVLVA